MGRPKGSRNKPTLDAEAMRTYRPETFALVEHTDPFQYLNDRAIPYIRRLELIADEARANGDPELEAKTVAFLARISPFYRAKVNALAPPLGLLKPPNLAGKTAEELQALEAIDIEGREVKEQ